VRRVVRCSGGLVCRESVAEGTVTAAAPIAARRLGAALRAAGRDRARIAFPSPLFAGRIVAFARDVLGIRSLASHQIEILDEYQTNENASVLVCTGQKKGKTECMIIGAAHSFATEREVKVWLYAPKVDHTNAVFWDPGRFPKYIVNAFLPCQACWPAHEAWCALVEVDPLDETPRPERCLNCSPLIPSELKDPRRPELGRISAWLNPTDAEAGLHAPDGRSVKAYTGRKEGSKGGFSGKLRLLADECSDITDQDRETMAGNLQGGGKIMGFGNLLHVHGWFAQAFRPNSKEGSRWSKIVQRSSRLSPNCRDRIEWSDGAITENGRWIRFPGGATDRPLGYIDNPHGPNERPIRGMAMPAQIEKNLSAWKGTNYITARIDAVPPGIVAGQLATMQLVAAAGQRWAATRAEGRLQLGVDVARSRDALAIAVRRGRKIIELHAEVLGQDDHAMGARLVADFAAKHRAPHERKPLVVFDKSGREGQDFARELAKYAGQIDMVGIVATHKPRDWKRYDRLRDELAFNFAAWLREGAVPPDGELEAELDVTTAQEVEVSYGGSGMKWRVSRVIDNDEVRKILGRSPDKRNACELATWNVDPGEATAVEADREDEAPLLAAPKTAARRRPARPSFDDDDGPIPSFDPFALADAATGWGLR
jgi:hypothetical protein